MHGVRRRAGSRSHNKGRPGSTHQPPALPQRPRPAAAPRPAKPRSLMYAFAQRSDTQVLDEPLYASYLRLTGLARPYRDQVRRRPAGRPASGTQGNAGAAPGSRRWSAEAGERRRSAAQRARAALSRRACPLAGAPRGRRSWRLRRTTATRSWQTRSWGHAASRWGGGGGAAPRAAARRAPDAAVGGPAGVRRGSVYLSIDRQRRTQCCRVFL